MVHNKAGLATPLRAPAALDPAGPFAAPLTDAAWVLFAMGAAVLLFVIVVLGAALFGPPSLRRWIAHRRLVISAGFALPTIVLTAVLIYGLVLTPRISAPPEPSDLRIRVTGEMWWWRVVYLDGAPFETANEIRIPTGRTIAFELHSADVIHSFWAPQLGAKLDMIPGHTNVVRLQADRPGIYRGQCTEYCGAAHALMAFEIIAMDPRDYAAWRAANAALAAASTNAGARMFEANGCGACHTIRGTTANGAMGPDLTHVASRRTLAAGILPNDAATRARWLAYPDNLKPGVRMPSYASLPEAERQSLALYLASLK